MKNKPIILVAGQPKTIFYEIFFKALKKNNFKSPMILISSIKILKSEMNKLNFKKKVETINLFDLKNYKLNNKKLYIINVDYVKKKEKIYLSECFKVAFKILKSRYTNKFINGPINKSEFLNKKFLGITEYISKHFRVNNSAMLIYNKDLSVCPITTHLPLKLVSSKINQKLILDKAMLIENFFKKNIGMKPKIAVTGLNPHCESILKNNEDYQIISPAIKKLRKKGLKIDGPYPADTIFLKQNIKKYNVIIGMYHDQVLSPIKAIKEYDAINVTLGLPFFRISPDHGPNEKMLNKNLSNPLSLIKSLKFLDKR